MEDNMTMKTAVASVLQFYKSSKAQSYVVPVDFSVLPVTIPSFFTEASLSWFLFLAVNI